MTKHILREYIEMLKTGGFTDITPSDDAFFDKTVELVSCDSREVIPGTLFICKGVHFNEKYLADAVKKGALGYVSDTEYPDAGIFNIKVSDIRPAMSALATFYYDNPSEKLNLTGITGTKGKSSTTYYIKSVLDEYLRSCHENESGVMSSIDTYDGAERFESHLTTPEPLELERHLNNAVSSGIKYMTMEVSSQGLKYDRVDGVRFSAACFLNIDYDHISPAEHPDFEDYFASKLKIFAQCRSAVVNLDSDRIGEIMEAAKKAESVITFSEKNPEADVYGYDVKKADGATVFRVRTKRFDREFRLTMPGLFNVPNALACIAVCQIYDIPERHIYAGLLKARVPGRMEVYANASRRVIAIVDYAHNRLSFEKLFESVKEEYPGRRIVIVFGCPGGKALDRRHDLGQIAGKYASHVYITEEDPGEEDAVEIGREIAKAVSAEGCGYSIDPDRGSAILNAVMESDTDTVVLVTGKGAETREKRGMEYITVPSDVDYVKEALHKYDVERHLSGIDQVAGIPGALPKILSCGKKTIVIKYGGAALDASNDEVADSILEDTAALKMAGARVVLVHGGGKDITRWLEKMGAETRFENGYRITDDTAMDVTEMVLSGEVNKRIVSALYKHGVAGVGISGRDGCLFLADKKKVEGTDLGHVGTITEADPRLVLSLIDSGFVPVVSPVAMGNDGLAYNINADEAAMALAKALKADKLIYLTDVEGIMTECGDDSTAVRTLSVSKAQELIDEGLITGGMVPKIRNCIDAINFGVSRVCILDGRVAHAVLLEVASDRIMGTVIEPD